MSADAVRVRQVRVAIFGPAVLGVIGVLLAAGGALGFALTRHSTDTRVGSPAGPAPTPAGLSSPAAATRGRFLLVGSDARLYRLGDLAHPLVVGSAPASLPTPVIGATNAPAGGVWLATADGHVYSAKAPRVGSVRLAEHAAPIVGIASAADGRGVRLASADGHVYALGALDRGEEHLPRRTARVVGIATAATDGYWLALADGTVSPFEAPTMGRLHLPAHAAPVVGIASALDGRGYWLATADGHVHAFGVPFRGDLATKRIRARVVGIAASAQGGYWLTTADGTVYPFAAPTFATRAGTRARAPIVAILPY